MKKTLLLFATFLFITLLNAQQYRLVTPKDNYVSSTDTITFRWSAVDSAADYNIIVATDADFTSTVFSQNNVQSGIQTVLFYGTFYWKISANTQQQQAWSYYRTFSIFSPSQLNGLVMWFDAAKNVTSSGGAVSQWNDLSPSALVATQSNATNKPVYVSGVPQLCNKPVVRFNGIGGASTSSNMNYTTVNLTNYTALMVRSYEPSNNYMQYVLGGVNNGLCAASSYYNGGHGTYQGGSLQCLYASLASLQVPGFGIYTTERNHVYRNGVESPPASLVNTNCNSVSGVSLSKLGARADAVSSDLSYKGDVGEIFVYDNVLDSANKKLAENYLRYKYAPPVDLGPDTVFSRFCVNVNLNSGSCFSSYLWSTGATTASINVTALGTYWLRAKDNLGYTSSDTIRVRPQISFNQLPPNMFLCAGDSIIWNTGYPSSGFQFNWSNGANTPSITIKTPGSYAVTITDAFNCTFSSGVVQVTVDNFPNYSLGPDTSFCSGNRLNFIYADSLASIVWSNGDTSTEPVIIDEGDYSVTAVNGNGCVAIDTVHVAISGYAPTVNFGNPVLCATDSVLFIDSTVPPSGNSIVWWTWDFGNGDTTNEQHPVHVFPASGQYDVSLTAYTDSGCVNGITKTLSVYLKPQADFQSKISCALAETQFQDFSTTAPPATVALWKWHFAGIDSSILTNPKYAFAAPGKYEVTLNVTNINGCSAYTSDSVEVFAALSCDFDFQNVCIGDSTVFTDATPSLSLVSWLWNTGDNHFITKKDFKYKYATAGNYNVSLQIQNAIGCVDSVNRMVSIYQNPTAAFDALVSCEDEYYTPLDNSVLHETVNTWNWNIAGATYSGQAPEHFFADTGSYTIKLLVTSASGCKDSASRVVQIKPIPTADFSFTPLYGDAPLNTIFVNESYNATSYFWNFGDGMTDVVTNPIHTYLTNDTFQIKLLAVSEFGCLDSITRSIIVVPTNLDISVDFVETNSAPQADGTVLISVIVYAHNEGTRLITNAKFYATIGSGGVISEVWDTLIQSGESKYYVFNANFVVATANANSYVCVEAKSVNNGETEMRLDNNRECASITGTLQLIGPSPNPARGNAYLGLILPKAGKVTIDIVDLLGRTVTQEEQLDLPAGRSDYDVPVKLLRAGEYFMRVKHNDDKLVRKFVVH